MNRSDRYPLILLGTFVVVFVLLGIAPADRLIWFAESALVVVALPIFILTFRNLRFSNLSYTALFLFLVLHTIGAHFTYTEVPLLECLQVGRNPYDRIVHFMYGFLMAPLAVELLAAKAPPRGIWVYLLPVLFLSSHAAIFEVIEWMFVAMLGPEHAEQYLCMQGDVWDAQKDMILAMAGAALGVAVVLQRNRRRRSNP
jgi:putative membrane protein